MPPQTLFLTGAPASSSLEWGSASLLETLTPPVARFAGIPQIRDSSPLSTCNTTAPRYASWRSLDFVRQHLPTGHSQANIWTEEYRGDADFLITSNLSFASPGSSLDDQQLPGDLESDPEPNPEVLSQFYEHSFAIHTTAASSKIVASQSKEALSHPSLDAGTPSFSIETYTTSTIDDFSTNSPLKVLSSRPTIPVRTFITDLRDVPNAKLLDSIHPQTMTVDIIVGLIRVAQPRVINTRWGTEVQLVELLTGDETKSGFGVTFWLSAPPKDDNSDMDVNNIKNELTALRPQDIVLLRNVALSCFRGRVYGQSLKKQRTKVHLLYRNRIDRDDVGGYYTIGDFDMEKELHSQLLKTMRVRDWVLRFVATGAFRVAGKDGMKTIVESLPLDTQ